MKPSADLLNLIDTHSAVRGRLTALAQQTVTARLAGFDSWYDDTQVANMAARIVAGVESAQRQTAAVTDAYLARAAGHLAGRTVRPAGAVDVTGLRLGIRHVDAYSRLGGYYGYLVSTGVDPAEAAQRAAHRGRTVAATDVTLAFRAQTQRFAETRNIDGFRRVIRPEITGGVCALCAKAADHLYDPATPMPVHDRCACSVLPVIGDKDPAAALNRADLQTVTAPMDPAQVTAFHATQIITHHHGELGPILGDRSQSWRSPADIAA